MIIFQTYFSKFSTLFVQSTAHKLVTGLTHQLKTTHWGLVDNSEAFLKALWSKFKPEPECRISSLQDARGTII